MERILVFDLSTTCTGVALCVMSGDSIRTISTTSIIPSKFDLSDLGYLNKRDVVIRGKKVKAYIKEDGEIITLTTKKKRDVEVKRARETHRLTYTSTELAGLIDSFNPSLIIQEDNMAFRSQDVTRKLGEVAGALQGIAASKGIKLTKINVNTARVMYDVPKLIKEIAKTLSEEELKSIPDLGKEVLKRVMLKKYAKYRLNSSMTTDESDALVLLDYWLVKVRGIQLQA